MRHIVLILALIVCFSLYASQNPSIQLNLFTVTDTSPQGSSEARWSLTIAKRPISTLVSTGGKPTLLAIQAIPVEGAQLYELRYDAGMSGTKTLFHVERTLILELQEKNRWKVHKDFLHKVTYLSGAQVVGSEERPVAWSKGRLHLGSIEDEEDSWFRWTGSSLAPIAPK